MKRFLIFLLVGSIGYGVNLGALYALTEYFHWFYLWASIAAYCIGVVTSFVLQKTWTFKNRRMARAHEEFTYFVIVSSINLAIHTLFVHILVESLSVQYLVAQAISSGLIALSSYFLYKKIFRSEVR